MRLMLAAGLLALAACADDPPPRRDNAPPAAPRGDPASFYECAMCRAHRDAPGVCCGAQARPCRYACTCGRHSDVPARCCGGDMPRAAAGLCPACGKRGIAGTPCCASRMK